jgi:hypothetical protein
MAPSYPVRRRSKKCCLNIPVFSPGFRPEAELRWSRAGHPLAKLQDIEIIQLVQKKANRISVLNLEMHGLDLFHTSPSW